MNPMQLSIYAQTGFVTMHNRIFVQFLWKTVYNRFCLRRSTVQHIANSAGTGLDAGQTMNGQPLMEGGQQTAAGQSLTGQSQQVPANPPGQLQNAANPGQTSAQNQVQTANGPAAQGQQAGPQAGPGPQAGGGSSANDDGVVDADYTEV